MTGWDDGYVSDVTYTSNVYRETTPAWLATAALLLGQRPPDLTQPFCYADLGCGLGLTAIVVAATCPHARVWGFDFNPAHIESARALAAAAGLTNIQFHETSFAELAALPDQALPDFDFIVSHGVLSWVSQENRDHLMRVIGRRLRPGGLAYLSYNVATGWGAMPPLRNLMRMLLEESRQRADQAATTVLDYVDRMQRGGARFFAANPAVEQRLTEIRKQDPRYIAHEFLNRDWTPLMFADVATRMTDAKCSYIGSTNLVENIDLVAVPQTMAEMIGQAPNTVMRETLRDFAAAQAFRRDIYRRGILSVPGAEHGRLTDAQAVQWMGKTVEDPIVLQTPMGAVAGLADVYRPLVEMLTAGPCTIGDIRQKAVSAQRSTADMVQAVALLMSSGYAHPAMPPSIQDAARTSADRLNTAIAAVGANGGDIGHLASPVIGSALKSDLLDSLIVQANRDGQALELDGLTERVLAILARSGRSVQQDGAPVTDPAQARQVLRGSVQTFLQQRLPVLARLGILAG